MSAARTWGEFDPASLDSVQAHEYKIIRGDFGYNLPVTGIIGLVATVAVRSVELLQSDFLGLLYYRHPCELGLVMWATCFVWPWVLLLAMLIYMEARCA